MYIRTRGTAVSHRETRWSVSGRGYDVAPPLAYRQRSARGAVVPRGQSRPPSARDPSPQLAIGRYALPEWPVLWLVPGWSTGPAPDGRPHVRLAGPWSPPGYARSPPGRRD